MRSRSFASDAGRAADGCRHAAEGVKEAGAAMLTTLLAIMLTATLSMIMLAVIMNEVMPTSYLQTSSQTIFAAEAGIDAVLGQIRTAQGAPDFMGIVYGDTAKLPCTAAGPVDGATGDLRYETTVQYYGEDPTSESEAWRAANDITCVAGAGPVTDPTYALLTSTGVGLPVAGTSAISSDRVIQAVYEFQVTNNNIPGGLIYDFDDDPALAQKFCLQAENPIAGSYVRYIPFGDCGTDDIRQLWIYSETYQLKLASTTVPSLAADELCITRPSGGSLPQRVTLEVCKASTDAARWTQLYSWNGYLGFTGQLNPISSGYAGVYLGTGTTSVSSGSYLQAISSQATRKAYSSFNPDPRVGAGNACIRDAPARQLPGVRALLRRDDGESELVVPDPVPVQAGPDPREPEPCLEPHVLLHRTNGGARLPRPAEDLRATLDGATKYCLTSPGTEGGHCHGSRPATLLSREPAVDAEREHRRLRDVATRSSTGTGGALRSASRRDRCHHMGRPDHLVHGCDLDMQRWPRAEVERSAEHDQRAPSAPTRRSAERRPAAWVAGYLLAAGLGAAIGSFLNVVVWRVPRRESVVTPPSACPACGHPIPDPRQRAAAVLGAAEGPLPGLRGADQQALPARRGARRGALFVLVVARFAGGPTLAAVPAYWYLACDRCGPDHDRPRHAPPPERHRAAELPGRRRCC